MPSKNGRTKLNEHTSTKKEGANQLEGTQGHLHDRAERGEKPEVSLMDMGLVGGISSSLGVRIWKRPSHVHLVNHPTSDFLLLS